MRFQTILGFIVFVGFIVFACILINQIRYLIEIRKNRTSRILKLVYRVVNWVLLPLESVKELITNKLNALVKKTASNKTELSGKSQDEYMLRVTSGNGSLKDLFVDPENSVSERENEKPKREKPGLDNVLFVLFCLIFSAGVIFCVISSGDVEARFIEGDFLESLPIYAIISMIINGAITYEGLLQLALFSTLSMVMMKRNQFKNPILTSLYELIFTVFCTSLLYLIPDSVYSAPGKVLSWLISSLNSDGNIVLVIFKIVVVGIVLLIALYLFIAILAVAIRETIASVIYSLFPLICVMVLVVFFTNRGWDPFLINACCYAISIVATVSVSQTRIKKDSMIDMELEEEKRKKEARKNKKY
jgi:hypothetical protein